jgi:hypothetical protein
MIMETCSSWDINGFSGFGDIWSALYFNQFVSLKLGKLCKWFAPFFLYLFSLVSCNFAIPKKVKELHATGLLNQ